MSSRNDQARVQIESLIGAHLTARVDLRDPRRGRVHLVTPHRIPRRRDRERHSRGFPARSDPRNGIRRRGRDHRQIRFPRKGNMQSLALRAVLIQADMHRPSGRRFEPVLFHKVRCRLGQHHVDEIAVSRQLLRQGYRFPCRRAAGHAKYDSCHS